MYYNWIPFQTIRTYYKNDTNGGLNIKRGLMTMKILVVDDDHQILFVLKSMLKFHGYETTIEGSSLKALELFNQTPNEFDIIITDQSMPPGIKGTELITKVLLSKPNMKCIITSGNGSTELFEIIKNYKLLGFAVEYMSKPFTMESIKNVIDKVTRQSGWVDSESQYYD